MLTDKFKSSNVNEKKIRFWPSALRNEEKNGSFNRSLNRLVLRE